MKLKNLVHTTKMKDSGDNRGSSFTMPYESLSFIKNIRDIHLASITPGSVRGNHYHKNHRELIIVVYSDAWILYWDNGPKTGTQKLSFSGSGSILIEIEHLASHAIVNEGNEDLYTIGLSDTPYDSENPDSHSRILV